MYFKVFTEPVIRVKIETLHCFSFDDNLTIFSVSNERKGRN